MTSPLDTWKAMTEQQKIEWLAVNVMSFRKSIKITNTQQRITVWASGRNDNGARKWNPLEDWNHWREVEEKIMEDKNLWNRYILKLHECVPDIDYEIGQHLITGIMKSDLPTRCQAAFLALSPPTP